METESWVMFQKYFVLFTFFHIIHYIYLFVEYLLAVMQVVKE